MHSLLAQRVFMWGPRLQLRPQSYRPADRLVRSETVLKHLNVRDHTSGVKNFSQTSPMEVFWGVEHEYGIHFVPQLHFCRVTVGIL
ncbi:hypothetical protein Y032_0030g2070 [Ancylostoma ceylanicum]|uniref:Uncharacterized protein n=1 Tax=Ancylostoma ceylanicum TaxID=53326 RepID=A0A016URD0_9BILA|nr:hypothetical protein Y032_0030g2070 [Ancylostoma ceylanicum]